jgi:cytochrome c oxidase subunit 2
MRVTKPGPSRVSPKAFYAFVGFLIVCGVSLHLATYNTIPWTATDLHGDTTEVAASFDITVADHEFQLPSDVLEVPCNGL